MPENYKYTFNKPFLTGKETEYIKTAVESGKISGDGIYTQKCQKFFEERFGFKKTLLTTSCTDALEMSALLINIRRSDEVIVPSYTFVSTANAFVLRGADIIFTDSSENNPNIDPGLVESLVTSKTKALVVMHYGGIACDMDKLIGIASKHNLILIEDAAQSVDSYYKAKPLGSFGQLSAFSFHETKNLISGEGGMIVINDDKYLKRSEIIREKGTNRSAFFRGEVDKYGWVDIGSSYLPSEIIAAFLYAQLENLEKIQAKRVALWNTYHDNLKHLEEYGKVKLPYLPEYATNNGHLFYLVCSSLQERTRLIDFLKNNGIQAVFHYQSLHKSPFYRDKYKGAPLANSDKYTDCLIRLPMYFDLETSDAEFISSVVRKFYKGS